MTTEEKKSGPVKVTGEALRPIIKDVGLELSDPLLEDFSALLTDFEAMIDLVKDDSSVQPRPDLSKYPRTDIHIPEDTDKGGWATKVTAKCTSPKSNLLANRTVALKDNMALAGVRCTNGTAMVDWVPEIDATIATRIMDHGATITGKSACENACMEGMSCTSITGHVHNPFADGYSAGGSSSGSGRLVATGSVDLAIGCDQGGSIRIPAAACGIVGLKPTWGLVPYTGIISLNPTIDHAGPMARTVRDCALLLEAIAGPDGWDDRQPPIELGGWPSEFVRDVDAVVELPKDSMLSGIKVGVMDEGFKVPGGCENVSAVVRSAAEKLSELGATVSSVSVPEHFKGVAAWAGSTFSSSAPGALLGVKVGRKQLDMPDRCALVGENLTQAQFDALGPGAAYMHLAYLWSKKHHGPQLHARCANIQKSISDAYDNALKDFDVLITPTVPEPPNKLPALDVSGRPLAYMIATKTIIANTSPTDSTGHPAISLPVGFSPARDDASVKLPVGMQIIGRKYRDADCLKVAAAWEKAFDWKSQ
ncbi:putative amidase [Astrocystis sublimbata]|nr:putative amidase [Astrocystis sublimbata]